MAPRIRSPVSRGDGARSQFAPAARMKHFRRSDQAGRERGNGPHRGRTSGMDRRGEEASMATMTAPKKRLSIRRAAPIAISSRPGASDRRVPAPRRDQLRDPAREPRGASGLAQRELPLGGKLATSPPTSPSSPSRCPAHTVMTLSGGFLFGLAAGAGMTVIAAKLGATAIFLAAPWVSGTRSTSASCREGRGRNAGADGARPARERSELSPAHAPRAGRSRSSSPISRRPFSA